MINKYGPEVVERGLKKIGFSDDFIDNAFGKNKKIKDYVGTSKKISLEAFDDINDRAAHNRFSSEVMLGKYDGGGPTSYISKVKDSGSCYFDLGDVFLASRNSSKGKIIF